MDKLFCIMLIVLNLTTIFGYWIGFNEGVKSVTNATSQTNVPPDTKAEPE